ncbi:transporter (formate/nitrite transporter family protein) [Salipiger sp. CCB-MM3]|uniref:formate/nitrite transporter family protein n=1 Tax=Salipiger sp. CCB-MM3 TaxID=1792508 RepID=UPI00080AB1F1|nr:formate/nitrite transporter family protein [Salipiger sp. CCB-MM3]ANT62573.1 transporter (formate/nitrite transporter family protein) [Salipiger sp. CCB-MM3]
MNNPEDPSRTQPAQSEAMHRRAEERSVLSASRLSARLIYEVIRRDGEEELNRPSVSLIWSGLAAGILISLSVIAQAVLKAYLPKADWAWLIECFGYSLGFIVVIYGRMQLFTENTITTVMPVVAQRSATCLRKMLRLWGIVLAANVTGATIASAFLLLPGVVPTELADSLLAVARHAVEGTASGNFFRALPAGVLIAALVWVMPGARGESLLIVLAMTWLLAAAGFAHVIAGTVEAGLLVWHGEIGVGHALFRFFLPVLAGNVAGGTAIFTLVTWGQVKNEVAQADEGGQEIGLPSGTRRA